ncbi:hypothetical protein BS78_K287900 [Paspalum vaginatum]|uniref:Uncharacterized protein n=1 Tax=Paspalum vaginatum TaxID=158149 RepID=A0A9W8CGK8_9POAL|nr:hypothetical protein BS78_K287900 [Paspalum vaginatum]
MRSEASQAKLSFPTELVVDASDRALDPSPSAASPAARRRVFSRPSATPRTMQSGDGSRGGKVRRRRRDWKGRRRRRRGLGLRRRRRDGHRRARRCGGG